MATNSKLSFSDIRSYLTAAEHGLGIGQMPEFMAAEGLRSGRLQRVLEGWTHPPPLYVVYLPDWLEPQGTHVPRLAGKDVRLCKGRSRPGSGPWRDPSQHVVDTVTTPVYTYMCNYTVTETNMGPEQWKPFQQCENPASQNL